MSDEHGCMCVRVHDRANEDGGATFGGQNHKTAARVFIHAHGFGGGSVRSTTLSRIQYNYKQTTERGIKRDCIQNDYIGGGRYA